jgi:CTP:molybdopterin cytidylyltransferase MocA
VRGFFVHPADVPLVTPATLVRLAEHLAGSAAVCPAFRGRHGHPPLLSAALIPVVLAYDGEGGLRRLLASLGHGLRTLECDDPAVLVDVDTPDDWRRVQEMVEGPSWTERAPP